MTTLTPEDRARLRDLAAKATPGPWRAEAMRAWGEEYTALSIQPIHESADWDPAHACCEPITDADSELIAAMRNALPALLDALDEAEATVERLRKWAQKESGFYNPAGDTVLVLLDGDA